MRVSQLYDEYSAALPGTAATNTLDEGVVSLLTEIAWQGFKRRLDNDPDFYASAGLRVEGPELAALPALRKLPDPAVVQRYASHAEVVELIRHVGLQGVLAGFFAGNLRAMAGPREGERGSMLAPGRTARRTARVLRRPAAQSAA